jgi:hypothetical protein
MIWFFLLLPSLVSSLIYTDVEGRSIALAGCFITRDKKLIDCGRKTVPIEGLYVSDCILDVNGFDDLVAIYPHDCKIFERSLIKKKSMMVKNLPSCVSILNTFTCVTVVEPFHVKRGNRALAAFVFVSMIIIYYCTL